LIVAASCVTRGMAARPSLVTSSRASRSSARAKKARTASPMPVMKHTRVTTNTYVFARLYVHLTVAMAIRLGMVASIAIVHFEAVFRAIGRKRMNKLFLWMMVACATSLLAAQPPTKPAWQWTVEERLAARFDEIARNRRIAEFEAARAAKRAETAATRSRRDLGDSGVTRPTDSVHGSDHPELLMPFEIMNVFTQAAFGADDETARVVRKDSARKARAIGLPETFLDEFENAARAFIGQQREELRLREHAYAGDATERSRTRARLQELRTLECHSRADAMRHLRKVFGHRFDQFLYSVIAPSVSRDIFEPITAQQLRNQEEGCQ